MKAIIDSSVLISAFLTPGRAASSLVAAGLSGRFELCVSDEILAETSRRLRGRPKLTAKYGFTDADVAAYIEDLTATTMVLSSLPMIEPVCRDPDDDHVLAAAIVARADCIVSGDGDLLDLGAYEGIRILTVGRFLAEIGAI